jgi:hypothetical protein
MTVTSRRRGCLIPIRRSRFGRGDQAFVMPLVVPAALLLLLGASTLLSRTIRNYLASSRQTDAQLARDVAESGMNRVLSILNPLAKHSSDPYASFLLASRWVPDSGVTYTTGLRGNTTQIRSGWRLTTLSRPAVQELLNRCGLAATGQHPNQLPPNNEDGYRNILSGAIGPRNTTSDTQFRYLVTNYVPPDRAASDLAWPSECEDFTSLSGGSGQISVEGRVIRNGRVLSTYTLTRTIDVQGWPLPTLPASWLDGSYQAALPGPPVGLRIAGEASNLNRLAMRYFKNIMTDVAPCILGFCGQRVALPQCLNNCLPNGQPFQDLTISSVPLETRILPLADIIPANDGDLPRYPFKTDRPPAGLTPRQINESRTTYPYDANGALFPECRESNDTDSNRPGQFRPNEIDCWIDSIGIPRRVASLSYEANSGDPNNVLITVNLQAGQVFDVLSGSQYRVTNITGWPGISGNALTGTVTSVSGQSIVLQVAASGTPSPPSSPLPQANATISPAGQINLRVNTDRRPVNLIILGNVGTDTPTGYVSLKHNVQGNQNYSHALNTNGTRALWNRLRIFGAEGSSLACANNLSQTFYIQPDPGSAAGDASLGGTFLWLPRGRLVYGPLGAASGTYPEALLTVWWLCNLDIRGLNTGFSTSSTNAAGLMQLITPLFGNQDALSAVLTGGYINSTGVFIPDKRFPVYPSLMRIRSAY